MMNIIKDSSSKKSNPYPHIKYQEVSEIREFFKRRKVKAKDFLAQVEKNRANPYTVTITCDDGRSMNFARIATFFDVVVNRRKGEILILSDGRIVSGQSSDSIPTWPGFTVGTIKGVCLPYGYAETISFGIVESSIMKEIVESSPMSPWVFDILTKHLSTHGILILSLKKFIKSRIIDRLRAKCEELSQVDFLIASLLKGDTDVFDLPLQSLFTDEQYGGGGKIIRMVEDYISNMDFLHMSPPKEWNISLRDILISQLVGDALEGK